MLKFIKGKKKLEFKTHIDMCFKFKFKIIQGFKGLK